MTHLLVVEDEARIAAFIEKGLSANGFSISLATNSEEAAAIALCQLTALAFLWPPTVKKPPRSPSMVKLI